MTAVTYFSRQVKMLLSCRLKTLGRFFFLVFLLFFYCEFLHYYLVLLQCTWPQSGVSSSFTLSPSPPLRVMVLADTHLLGYKEGHWFDKLRREWQMERSFQSAMMIHSPDVIFVLGDLVDEGKWCGDVEFFVHIERFRKMFRHSEKSKMHVLVGNHDIGFHYMMSDDKNKRFEKAFDAPPIRAIRIRDVLFVLVNSMALEGDGCKFCRAAEKSLKQMSQSLSCAKSRSSRSSQQPCKTQPDYLSYTRPILMQHFPLYRQSDANCSLPDQAPDDIKYIPFKENFDCLSKSSTKQLFNWLDPRLVISAHTHHGCYHLHDNQTPEWTVASFNWRNKRNPTFLLILADGESHSVKQCFLPDENTVLWIYILGGLVILILTIIIPRYFASKVTDKFH